MPSVVTATFVLLALAGGVVHLQHNETLLRGRS